MTLKYFLSAIFIVLCFSAQAYSVSGYVTDKSTGEVLIGAIISEASKHHQAISNNYGFFSLIIPKQDSVRLTVTCLGYSRMDTILFSPIQKVLSLQLKSESILLNEAVVVSEKRPEQKTEMNTIDLPLEQIKTLPAIGGENDIMKALQLMPGVQSGSEGNSGLYVRGGSPDQNLIIVDDVPLYNVNHIGGFVSVFNTDALRSVKLIKGGAPARYGGRLSSVLDIRMKEGNNQQYIVQGGIGLVSTRLSVEGPIGNNTSFILSGRRFLLDLFTRPISRLSFEGVTLGYYFYDTNLKLNHTFSEKDKLFFSFYQGDDKILVKVKNKNDDNLQDKFSGNIKWGNLLGAIRWNHVFNSKLFCNTSTTYTRYRYIADNTLLDYSEDRKIYTAFGSSLYDATAKFDLDYYPHNDIVIRSGAGYTYHEFLPGKRNFLNRESGKITLDTTYGTKLYANEVFMYVESQIQLLKCLSTNVGLRYAGYIVKQKKYLSPEPRFSANYMLNDSASIKFSFSKTNQFVHQLSFSGVGMPTDLWVPSTEDVPPSSAYQVAIGFAQTYSSKMELEIEAYYKNMSNLIDYKEGATFYNTSSKWQRIVEKRGKGEAYGIEFFLRKKIGRSTGWVAYTLSKSTRQFDNINFGKPFAYRYDRRHDLSLVYSYKINTNIDLSATWVFGTGNPITLAIAKYNTAGDLFPNEQAIFGIDYNQTAYVYNGKNNYRMSAFHKLDIGINFRKEKKWGERIWSFSIYNVYSRQNPLFYYYDTSGRENDTTLRLYQQSLFPIMPSVSYNFVFKNFQKKQRVKEE